jgi:hypothetical protein
MAESVHVMWWHKVLFLVGEGDEQFLSVKDAACQRINNIEGFEILMGNEYGDDGCTCFHALYFSPTAALECEDLISSSIKCEQPDPDVEDGLHSIVPAC